MISSFSFSWRISSSVLFSSCFLFFAWRMLLPTPSAPFSLSIFLTLLPVLLLLTALLRVRKLSLIQTKDILKFNFNHFKIEILVNKVFLSKELFYLRVDPENILELVFLCLKDFIDCLSDLRLKMLEYWVELYITIFVFIIFVNWSFIKCSFKISKILVQLVFNLVN